MAIVYSPRPKRPAASAPAIVQKPAAPERERDPEARRRAEEWIARQLAEAAQPPKPTPRRD